MSSSVLENQFMMWLELLFEEPHGEAIVDDSMLDLYKLWLSDIEDTKNGYPIKSISEVPFVEDYLLEKMKHLKPKKQQPTLVLTHDIDYLYPTYLMKLKKAIGYRDFELGNKEKDYLNSIDKYIEVGKRYIEQNEAPHFFIPFPKKPRKFFSCFIHKIIDPSYRLTERVGKDFVNIVKRESVGVGLHGSFYSLQCGQYSLEKNELENTFDNTVNTNRQHWLNVNSVECLTKLSQSGIKLDSSLGWNGNLGFRGGFCRPYPILLESDLVLWELPMLLMDGVLFYDLKLKENEALEVSKEWLGKVKNRGGCVAINWHGRTFSRSYGWGTTYEKLLEWSKREGFRIINVKQLMRELDLNDGK